MTEGTEMAKLSDEVLMQIFHHLPSLGDQLRVERVSRRFQRCLIELLNTNPTPFEYEKRGTRVLRNGTRVPECLLNGTRVLRDQLPRAVNSLANKVKFHSINIDTRRAQTKDDLHWILTAVVDSNFDCLEKVTRVEISSDTGCSEILLREAVVKCAKLSELRLNFYVNPMQSDVSKWESDDSDLCRMDLGAVLEGKELTLINISLENYPQEQVVRLFQSIKQNTLKNVRLDLRRVPLDKLGTELGGGAWASLEEMDIRGNWGDMQIDEFFSSLRHLPSLRKCNFVLGDTGFSDQWVAAVTSLFTNQIHITVVFHQNFSGGHQVATGCRFVPLIRQVQAVHPELEVGFGPKSDTLTLTLGNVFFQHHFKPSVSDHSDHSKCTNCGIFYPTLIARIALKMNQYRKRWTGGGFSELVLVMQKQEEAVHLANERLDRCRIDTVVSDLNQATSFDRVHRWTAVHAEMNEAHTLATISFVRVDFLGQFKITVDCGQCLSNVCFRCINV